jgi:hypothetical protein
VFWKGVPGCAGEEHDTRTSVYGIGQRVSPPSHSTSPRVKVDQCVVS